MRKLISLALLAQMSATIPAMAQEGFVLQDKPSAQCSIYLCDSINGPTYAPDGSIVRPIGWEKWVFIGSPLTPDELNGGKATFREFHSVYIEPSAFDHYRAFGEFPNGTQIVKARTLIYRPSDGDMCLDFNEETGACLAVSGWGYFNGDYSGFELTVKDTTRFDDPGGWVYMNFGEERPWAPTAEPFNSASCNSCHEANGGDDFVFTQFYPVLRDNDPKLKRGVVPAATEAKEEEEALIRQLPTVLSPVPVNEEELFAYLQNGEYKSFETQETEAHPSAGPHLDYGHPVKVFFSDAVAKSLSGGYDVHPKGSALVKELYKENSDELTGWAVAVKTEEDSDNGKGWFWVEYMSTEDPSMKPVEAGNGVGLCSGCHRGGNDFVLSHLPE